MKISKEVKVAVLGIVALVCLYYGYMFLKGTDLFSKTAEYSIEYQNVDGLTVSSPVILNGVSVGRVRRLSIIPEKNNSILVEIEVDKNIAVGDSTVAILANSDLLGGKAINLRLGNNTLTYSGGEKLIPEVQKSITEVISERTMPLLGTVDSTLIRINTFFDKDTKESFKNIVKHTEDATASINKILAQNERNVNVLASNFVDMSYSLKQTEKKFNNLIVSLNELSDTLKNAQVNETVRNLNKAIVEVQTAMKTLNEQQGTIGKLMKDDSLYNNFNSTAHSLDILLKDFKDHPKRYVNFSLIGGGEKTKVNHADKVLKADKVKDAKTIEKAIHVDK